MKSGLPWPFTMSEVLQLCGIILGPVSVSGDVVTLGIRFWGKKKKKKKEK